MARQRPVEVERPSASAARPTSAAAPATLASARMPAGRVAVAELARSVAAGASLSNGAVAQMVMREIGAYWAGLGDEQLDASQPAPSEAPAKAEAVDELTSLRRTFRAEILETLEAFAAKPAVEGSPGFDKFLTPATVAMERQTVGWTSCITTLSKIFNDAANVINEKLGVKVKRTKKGYLINSMYGAVKFAANSEAEKHARAVNAWTTWPGTDEPNPDKEDKAHPQPGDIVLLQKASGAFGHVGFFHSWRVVDGQEYWTTVDGGQGTMGEWKDGKYVAGSGRQEIKRRDRKFWPDGRIEGEPGQGPTLKVRGWVNVETLVLAAAKGA